MKQLEGKRVRWVEPPFGATINEKTPVIVLHPVSDTLREEAAPAAARGFRLCKVSPILSVTEEPLGLCAIYQHKSKPDYPRFQSAHIAQFTTLASAAIERMRGDEALNRSAGLLERTQQLSSTCCFSWRAKTGEISWSKELGQLFELDAAEVPVTLGLIGTRIHPEDLPSFNEMIERARSGVSDFEFEHRLLLPDNSVKYLHVLAHRTRDQEGELEYIGAVQDVTHRRHAEEAVAKLRAELARAAKVASLGVLTASIAQQVILNLLLNASDAMGGIDDRPRQILIRTERDEEDRVQLSVRDTGVGFGPQGADRLFDAFYTTKSNGMGIGLSVSRSIIESHRGRLWATPNDGPGATFSFSIPTGPMTAAITGAGTLGAIRPSTATAAEQRHVRNL